MFNEEEVIEEFANYVQLFSEYYSLKDDHDRHKLDHIFMQYLKNSLSAVINSMKIVLVYCKDEKIELRSLKSFEKILSKKSKKKFKQIFRPFVSRNNK